MTTENRPPKWVELRDLLKEVDRVKEELLKRKNIFTTVVNSEYSSQKNIDVSNTVITNIDNTLKDAQKKIDNVNIVINKKTLTNKKARCNDKTLKLYLEQVTIIEEVVHEIAGLDQVLINSLRKKIDDDKKENDGK